MNSPDDYLSIDTPENVAFGYDVAGIGSRFLAALVDTIVILLLQGIVNFVLILLAGEFLRAALPSESSYFIWISAIFGLVAFAFFWGYYIFFEMSWNGQSPGKRWVGLRVIRTDGTPITLTESIIRNLIRLVDFLPFYYGLGVVTMFINSQSRRLGDLAAGTLVVRDRPDISLESLAAETASPVFGQRNISAATANLPLERLTPHDLQMVEEFLRRRNQLSNRAELAHGLVQLLYERMELAPPQLDGWEAEALLADISQISQSRRREI
jgi:uncharacterized RDD family membrane protein YckC